MYTKYISGKVNETQHIVFFLTETSIFGIINSVYNETDSVGGHSRRI